MRPLGLRLVKSCASKSPKLDDIDKFTATYLGGFCLRSYAQLPAVGTSGGIPMFWDESVVDITDIVLLEFCRSASVTLRESNTAFKITTVYGPSTVLPISLPS